MKMYFLYILSIAHLLGACSASRNTSIDTTLQKKWDIVFIDSVNNEKVTVAEAFIDFTNPGKGSAKAGCNSMFFTSDLLKNNKIKISQIGSTMMMCPEMEPENAFGKLLPQVNNYEIKDSVLLLKIGERLVMRGQ